ncbi:hypothetical protein IG631_20731 [Alternaria alternata]|nr:hypothetical protein IG631_20731 [Alternaria alternata]
MLILAAAPLLAATIYMTLGRLIRALDATHHAVLNPRWTTKIYVIIDIGSFVCQIMGSAMQTSGDPEGVKTGNTVVIAGLGTQLVAFAFFILMAVVFHRRLNNKPTSTSLRTHVRWQRYMWALYSVSVLVVVRSIFRLAEFVEGPESKVYQTEAYLYVFDAALMFGVVVIMAVLHPGVLLRAVRKAEMIPLGDDDENGGYLLRGNGSKCLVAETITARRTVQRRAYSITGFFARLGVDRELRERADSVSTASVPSTPIFFCHHRFRMIYLCNCYLHLASNVVGRRTPSAPQCSTFYSRRYRFSLPKVSTTASYLLVSNHSLEYHIPELLQIFHENLGNPSASRENGSRSSLKPLPPLPAYCRNDRPGKKIASVVASKHFTYGAKLRACDVCVMSHNFNSIAASESACVRVFGKFGH